MLTCKARTTFVSVPETTLNESLIFYTISAKSNLTCIFEYICATINYEAKLIGFSLVTINQINISKIIR